MKTAWFFDNSHKIFSHLLMWASLMFVIIVFSLLIGIRLWRDKVFAVGWHVPLSQRFDRDRLFAHMGLAVLVQLFKVHGLCILRVPVALLLHWVHSFHFFGHEKTTDFLSFQRFQISRSGSWDVSAVQTDVLAGVFLWLFLPLNVLLVVFKI